MVRSMSAPPLKTCPKELCGQKKWGRGRVTKQITSGAGLLFKGSGFYITDYRSNNYKESAKKDTTTSTTGTPTAAATPTTPATASTPAKAEAKPAAKAASKSDKT